MPLQGVVEARLALDGLAGSALGLAIADREMDHERDRADNHDDLRGDARPNARHVLGAVLQTKE